MLKKFIIWYLKYKCHGSYRYKGNIVRVFTEQWYNENIKNK